MTEIIEPWNELEVKHISSTDVTRTLAAFYQRGIPIDVARRELADKIFDIQQNKRGRKRKYGRK